MFTAENAWWLWLVASLVLVGIEALSADFVFLMLAGGALGGSVTAGLGGGFLAQALVAAGTSGLLLGAVRPVLKRRFTVNEHPPLGADLHIGAPAVVTETVTESDGRIKLAGEIWSARLEHDPREELTLEPGTDVRVSRIEGATAIVRPDPFHHYQPPPSELDLP